VTAEPSKPRGADVELYEDYYVGDDIPAGILRPHVIVINGVPTHIAADSLAIKYAEDGTIVVSVDLQVRSLVAQGRQIPKPQTAEERRQHEELVKRLGRPKSRLQDVRPQDVLDCSGPDLVGKRVRIQNLDTVPDFLVGRTAEITKFDATRNSPFDIRLEEPVIGQALFWCAVRREFKVIE
jgi:hypothetical protein